MSAADCSKLADWTVLDDGRAEPTTPPTQPMPQPADVPLDAAWMEALFPAKSAAKRATWLAALADAEFDTVGELAALDIAAWAGIGLPLAVSSVMQRAVAEPAARTALVTLAEPTPRPAAAPVDQIDVVVMDVSMSMRARSEVDNGDANDPDNALCKGFNKTREDVSKMVFHTMIDKTLVFELSHTVGLIAFGATVTPIAITREYEAFHDELGRLDANQRRTRLYDAIQAAADMIDTWEEDNAPLLAKDVRKRVFVLTDGEDNASGVAPWAVAKSLQERGVVLDAIPMAGRNPVLQTMCRASGGLCFDVVSVEQGIGLFEREATLRVACREEVARAPVIADCGAFEALRRECAASAATTEVRSAAPKALFAPCLSAESLRRKTAEVASGAAGGGPPPAVRRALKEYAAVSREPPEGWQVFVGAEDVLQWKAVLSGLPAPYDEGTWLLTVAFPTNYPFSAPRVRFVTPTYHCNVSADGMICLDRLQGAWSPATTIRDLLAAIRALLLAPDAMNPLDAYKATLYRDDRAQYEREAARHTRAHAGQAIDALAPKYKLATAAAAGAAAPGA